MAIKNKVFAFFRYVFSVLFILIIFYVFYYIKEASFKNIFLINKDNVLTQTKVEMITVTNTVYVSYDNTAELFKELEAKEKVILKLSDEISEYEEERLKFLLKIKNLEA